MSTSVNPGEARETRQRISPADAPRDGAAPPPSAYLLIRIWMPSQPAADRGLLTWAAENSLIQMIADLVSASGGAPAGKRNNGLIARFRNAADAGTAAVRLQRAIAGFAAQSKAPPAASIALFCADKGAGELDESSDELETASVLASAAQPAQILLTAAACAELHLNAPYTSRNAAPFRMPNGMHSNLRAYQLTWNAASPISGERPPTEKTTTPRLTDPEISGAKPIRTQLPAALRDAVPQPGLFNPAHPASRSRRRLPVYAGSAAVMVTIVAAGTWSLMQPSNPHRISTPHVNTGGMQDPPRAVTPTPKPAQASPPQPEPGLADPPPKITERVSPGNGSEAPGFQPSNRIASGKIPSEKIAPAKGLANADGFFRGDIRWLLERADRESGDGQYDAAERDYKIVQKLDPGNSAARNGNARNSARRSEQQ
jgi:hypothetical protein